jgi:hypothetical protein
MFQGAWHTFSWQWEFGEKCDVQREHWIVKGSTRNVTFLDYIVAKKSTATFLFGQLILFRFSINFL